MLIHLFNGVVYGALLIIMCSGLALIYGLRRVINFAHCASLRRVPLGAPLPCRVLQMPVRKEVELASHKMGVDVPLNKTFATAWKAKFNRLPTDNEGQSYNAMLVMFECVKKSGSVKPADVAKAVRGMTLETLYGPATKRAQDNQLVLPTYSARAKVADGVLRPEIEQRFDPSLTPAPSPLCKL
ncbi:Branched-chain amino acid ABC-type transport system, permease components [Variovorax sp. PBL-H6]|uniref:ABC transporter substrate-binding protein n=1 Tax=Variovorax sp. PBL-H6 TaxID=434009 RepID=UPI0013177AFB|nr:ABC transporter substrate-binding protein [Variovorax sp. PBL-H6]VTU32167.1 Branched-chain amino acid ABC-type transport system, permease components [Variovorax sp. PBL-H6]